MSDTLKIAQVDARTNWSGCPRNDDRDHGRPPGLPKFGLAYHHGTFQWPQPTRKLFASTKRAWTLTSLWTQRTRPQVTLKTADSFQQRPHPIFFSSKKKEERRTKNGRQEIA